ncbi:MAG: T9SS type A sorting domain-containing protein [Bacteroidota bacterium]
MKSIAYILTMLVCLNVSGGLAQDSTLQLVRSVFHSAGTFADNAGLSISYTIGEPMVETYSALQGDLIFTQGFQQPDTTKVLGPNSIEAPEIQVSYNIYPNPVRDRLFVELETDVPARMRVALYDMKGKETSVPSQEGLVVGSKTLTFDTETLPIGVYILRLHRADGRVIRAFKIQKDL